MAAEARLQIDEVEFTPSSVRGLPQNERDAVAVSTLNHGNSLVVLSRFGDAVWDLSPYIPNANMGRSRKYLSWSGIPACFLNSAKAIVYRYWMVGIPGIGKPTATSVFSFFERLRRFLNWADQKGFNRLADIRPLHCIQYVEDCRVKCASPSSVTSFLLPVEALYSLREHSEDALTSHPWPETSAYMLASSMRNPSNAYVPITKIIPPEIVNILFQKAEAILDDADRMLNRRFMEQITWTHHRFNPIRNACYFILGIITGCRNHELASIEVGAAKTTVQDGEQYHWLCGVSLKTHTGKTEWMMPQIGLRCVQVMERWSEPARKEIREQLAEMETSIAVMQSDLPKLKELLQERARLQALQNKLFLAFGRHYSSVTSLGGESWNRHLRNFASDCGVDWNFHTHQLRRTFAAIAAHHVLGDLRYLRHHYKHWSIDMTALYALNEKQEQELFDEVLFAMREQKVAIIQHWLDDTTLITGGAAEPIKSFRQKHTLNSVKSRQVLAEETSDKVAIRATGHGWCLAVDTGCGGQGIYERTLCIDCKNGVIDDTHLPIWKGLFDQQVELQKVADQCGPGGKLRIARDLAGAAKVLARLGVGVSIDPEVIGEEK